MAVRRLQHRRHPHQPRRRTFQRPLGVHTSSRHRLESPRFGLAYLGFTRDATSWTVLLPWFVLAGIGIGCVETAEHTAVATHAPEHLGGSAFGLLAATQSFGNLAASAVARSCETSPLGVVLGHVEHGELRGLRG
ncbi:MAG: hypothetical protein WKF58_16110 [Ilumatobacteraceae bacterium]